MILPRSCRCSTVWLLYVCGKDYHNITTLDPLKPATGRTLRQLKDASTHRSTFCGLHGAFEQSLRFPINSERLDAGVFTSMLLATKRSSRTCATRATDVIFVRKHCSRRRRHTQVDIRMRRKSHVNAGTVPESEYAGTWPA